jgi:hypothetical protein
MGLMVPKALEVSLTSLGLIFFRLPDEIWKNRSFYQYLRKPSGNWRI